MKGNYRIRLHFVGGGKMQVAYAAQSARDAAFDALLADLSAGEKKWLTFGGALINRLKLTHVEKFEKPQKEKGHERKGIRRLYARMALDER